MRRFKLPAFRKRHDGAVVYGVHYVRLMCVVRSLDHVDNLISSSFVAFCFA